MCDSHIYIHDTYSHFTFYIMGKHFCFLIASGSIERAGESREADLQCVQFCNRVFRKLSTRVICANISKMQKKTTR